MGCCGSKEEEAQVESFSSKYDCSFQVSERLGEGGFATVYSCTNKSTRKLFAVKVINKSKLSKQDEENVLHEVNIMRRLNHPNVVNCLDFFGEHSRFFVIMDLVEGGELFDRIVQKTTAKGSYNELEARITMKIMFLALKYLHDTNIVHRDLKPENLLLESKRDDSSLKIADFGFATYCPAGIELTDGVGTIGYCAPEVMNHKPYGKAVDIWSMGVISFIIVGGYPPFHEANEFINRKNMLNANFQFVASHWAHISDDLKELIKGMIHKDPNTRLTVDEVLSHKWMNANDQSLSRRDLTVNMQQLRRFNAKRKFRACVRAIVATNRMALVLKKLKNIKIGGTSEIAASHGTPTLGTTTTTNSPKHSSKTKGLSELKSPLLDNQMI